MLTSKEYRELQGKRTHKAEIERGRELFAVLPNSHLYITSQNHRLRGSAGIPDCMVFYDGRFCFWEVKVGNDSLSPAQALFIERAEGADVDVCVGDLGDLVDHLGIGKQEMQHG